MLNLAAVTVALKGVGGKFENHSTFLGGRVFSVASAVTDYKQILIRVNPVNNPFANPR